MTTLNPAGWWAEGASAGMATGTLVMLYRPGAAGALAVAVAVLLGVSAWHRTRPTPPPGSTMDPPRIR